MSYKLALHLHATFTEQVFPIYKYITIFLISSIRNKNSHNETNVKGSVEGISPHSNYLFIEYLSGLM